MLGAVSIPNECIIIISSVSMTVSPVIVKAIDQQPLDSGDVQDPTLRLSARTTMTMYQCVELGVETGLME